MWLLLRWVSLAKLPSIVPQQATGTSETTLFDVSTTLIDLHTHGNLDRHHKIIICMAAMPTKSHHPSISNWGLSVANQLAGLPGGNHLVLA